ncbi:hypothetical protein [Chelatococcus asaccharovorans]|nr:hypothetical protein [Chelatococcus asaccharovorans]
MVALALARSMTTRSSPCPIAKAIRFLPITAMLPGGNFEIERRINNP